MNSMPSIRPEGQTVPADAAQFVAALGGDSAQFTFQTFADKRPDARLARIRHGAIAEHADALRRLNARGAGVFVTVNATDGRGRTAANIKAVRGYFVDLDGAPLEPVQAAPLPPHVIVESSPGRWHAYWLLAPGAPLASFRRVQQAIAERFSADPKVCDLPRVMRLPGFLHQKHAAFQSRIVELRDVPRITHAEFVAAFGIESAPVASKPAANAASAPKKPAHRLAETIPQGGRNGTLLSLAAGLVRRGIIGDELNRRMQRINAERSTPPLGADEVDTICERAASYGSNGFVMIPHKLLDSGAWLELPPAAQSLVIAGLRRAGQANAPFALPFSDFAGCAGFKADRSFYGMRDAALNAGFLKLDTAARRTQHGCTAALFTVSPDALGGSLTRKKTASGIVSRYPAKRRSALTRKKTEVLRALTGSCALGGGVDLGTASKPSTQTMAALCVLVDNRPLHIPSAARYYAQQAAA